MYAPGKSGFEQQWHKGDVHHGSVGLCLRSAGTSLGNHTSHIAETSGFWGSDSMLHAAYKAAVGSAHAGSAEKPSFGHLALD